MRDVRRTGGGRGLHGGREKSGCGVSRMISVLSISARTSGRLQPRTRGMAHDGGTRGGPFHGEMDIPELNGKDQEEGSPKQAGSC